MKPTLLALVLLMGLAGLVLFASEETVEQATAYVSDVLEFDLSDAGEEDGGALDGG